MSVAASFFSGQTWSMLEIVPNYIYQFQAICYACRWATCSRWSSTTLLPVKLTVMLGTSGSSTHSPSVVRRTQTNEVNVHGTGLGKGVGELGMFSFDCYCDDSLDQYVVVAVFWQAVVWNGMESLIYFAVSLRAMLCYIYMFFIRLFNKKMHGCVAPITRTPKSVISLQLWGPSVWNGRHNNKPP